MGSHVIECTKHTGAWCYHCVIDWQVQEAENSKINRWFMINEVSTSPLHLSSYLPEWQQSKEGERDQRRTIKTILLVKGNERMLLKEKKRVSFRKAKNENPLGVK